MFNQSLPWHRLRDVHNFHCINTSTLETSSRRILRSTMRSHLHIALSFVLTLPIFAQNPTDPPTGQHPILTLLGKGVQIYTCQQSGGMWQWTFQAPEATLYDVDNVRVGTHGAGPVWTYKDGSSVKGELVQRSAAPEPGAVPWLLLKTAGKEGSGVLSAVEFIRRSDTHGGAASATGCDAEHLNTSSRVPYTATYTFYGSKP